MLALGVDKDSDGVLDSAEFVAALSKVSWWKLSRKTPDEWFNEISLAITDAKKSKPFGLLVGRRITQALKAVGGARDAGTIPMKSSSCCSCNATFIHLEYFYIHFV